jgi:hypothetical protein
MKNKTAVEFLISQLPLSGKMAIMDKIKQAKEMEKEQHQKTAIHFFPTSLRKEYFEQYYNEHYGN